MPAGSGTMPAVSAHVADNGSQAFPGRLLAVLGIGLVVLAMYGARNFPLFQLPGDSRAWLTPPDFAAIEDVDARKERFFEFLLPAVAYVNAEVRARRERLQQIEARAADDRMTRADRAWIERMATRYWVEGEPLSRQLELLDRRIDIVPPALALAQAAIESGWGRSRFAREGNNLFGEWCFEPGCGIVPDQRPRDASYEVRAFPTVLHSVRSYVRNLNTHPAYGGLRKLRHQARQAGREPRAVELAAGLARYSERGMAYVEEVRTVIRSNTLEARARAG